MVVSGVGRGYWRGCVDIFVSVLVDACVSGGVRECIAGCVTV